MKYKTIVTVVIIAFIVGCNPTPKPNGKPDQNDKPDPPIVKLPPPKTDLNSFISRTENYDMLSVQESKDWLRKNYWTVTYSGNNIIIQRNYKSGNVTDTNKYTISKGAAMVCTKECYVHN